MTKHGHIGKGVQNRKEHGYVVSEVPLYTEADIYLFDDPLAAVDPAIAKKIFKECISNEGILNNKTRLLLSVSEVKALGCFLNNF